jgi:hypothetical protein
MRARFLPLSAILARYCRRRVPPRSRAAALPSAWPDSRPGAPCSVLTAVTAAHSRAAAAPAQALLPPYAALLRVAARGPSCWLSMVSARRLSPSTGRSDRSTVGDPPALSLQRRGPARRFLSRSRQGEVVRKDRRSRVGVVQDEPTLACYCSTSRHNQPSKRRL